MSDIFQNVYNFIITSLETHGLNALKALGILLAGLVIARITYLLIMKIFERFKIIEFIDRIWNDLSDTATNKSKDGSKEAPKGLVFVSEKANIEKVTSKAFAYYVFIIFFRLAIVQIGIVDVEIFLSEVISYLPNLFIGLLILFFGIRFSSFIFEVTYHSLSLQNEKTAKILAFTGKGIIVFFTILATLDHIKIIDKSITQTLLVGFVGMLALAGGLAFGLGGKDIAKEILESLKK